MHRSPVLTVLSVLLVAATAASAQAAPGAEVERSRVLGSAAFSKAPLARVVAAAGSPRTQASAPTAVSASSTAVGSLPTGYPSAATTGVPAGTVLRPSGSLVLKTAGQVIDGLAVDGCVTVTAPGVVIRRSVIRCGGGQYAVTIRGGSRLTMEDVEIDGRGTVSVAICCGDYTLRRGNVHHVVDGPRLSSGTTVVDSYVHDLVRKDGSHNDTLQSTGGKGMVVRHNTLLAYRAETRDPFNASIMLGSTTAPSLEDVVVEDNLMNGGNYTVNVRKDVVARNVVFRRNVFLRDFRYGPAAGTGSVTWATDNVWADTRQSVR